jgi:hypothetical protein
LALARCNGYKSHTAANSTFGASRISLASNIPRPPQPIRPIRARSLAPKTRLRDAAVNTMAAAPVLMKLRRVNPCFSCVDFFISGRGLAGSGT